MIHPDIPNLMTTEATVHPTTGRVAKSRKTLLGYVPMISPFYAYHPATRLILFLFLGVIPLFIFIPEVNMLLLLVNLALLRWGRIDIKRLKMYMPVIFTVAIFMFTVVILAPGNDPRYTPLDLFGKTIYYQPVFFTFGAYWRLIAMLFGTILYFSTNRERDLLVGLRALRLPFVASYVVGLSIRSSGMFMEDFRTIREAEQARGLDTKAMRFSDQVKLYMMYLIPLFSIALRRADEISNALFARGYTLTGRTSTGEPRQDYIRSIYSYSKRDYVAIAIMVGIFVVTALAQILFGVFAIENSPLNIYLRQALGIPF
ncbi:MAG: energy-coupling factor transporter transmembrane protein EcfT [Anaerolineae bacterium]|nr:energy-coupling factor transporter transmembrane protein EcfT [Anaerolineae bacterium]MBT4310828.1 energy-coupling factor transporter transmembrane protein EcfT [Anaerolineae bacterium]MBT7775741.1 energy-coupling factor transporter transmembrane protein EcfT [Anaerolineae bacterium]